MRACVCVFLLAFCELLHLLVLFLNPSWQLFRLLFASKPKRTANGADTQRNYNKLFGLAINKYNWIFFFFLLFVSFV